MQENSQRFVVKHIAKSLQATTQPKLVKELAYPNAPQEMKVSSWNERCPVANKGYTQCGEIAKLKLFYYI